MTTTPPPLSALPKPQEANGQAPIATPSKAPAGAVEQFLRSWWKEGENQKRFVNLWGGQKEAKQAFVMALNAIQSTPALLKCNPYSLITCILKAGELKLQPGVMQECAFVPRKINGQMEAVFTPMYQGLIKLSYNAGLKSITAKVVYERDEFDFDEASFPPYLHHKRSLAKERGNPIAAWARAILPSGDPIIEVMPIHEIEAIRDRSSAAGNNGPWSTHFDLMCRKTVVKRLLKYAPKSSEVVNVLSEDEHNNDEKVVQTIARNSHSQMSDPGFLIDYNTGEVLPDVTDVTET